MAIVAKWLTHRIVAPALVGSIPIVRPNEETKHLFSLFFWMFRKLNAMQGHERFQCAIKKSHKMCTQNHLNVIRNTVFRKIIPKIICIIDFLLNPNKKNNENILID